MNRSQTGQTEPSSTSGLAGDRLGLLALVLALAALAVVLGAVAQGWSLSQQEFSSDSGERLKQFVRFVAFFGGSSASVVFLVGAVLAHAVGGRDDRSGAGQAAMWIGFLVGLVVAVLAAAASFDSLVLTGDSTGSRVTFGYGGEALAVRFGAVLPTLAGALVALVASWCAFKELPISQAPASPAPAGESDAVVDAEQA